MAARRSLVPTPTYPDLPVSARRDDILAALAAHQVVVVAGETGSGKTTQLPKMLLEAGRGVRGMVGHTQPRRIAARSVAARLAEELGTAVGDLVGVTVRFSDQVGDRTLVKVMTDGILLAEIARDPRLLRYDAVVVDEAHERSLNVDVLLGYLRRLLPDRPDLQVVVTSATIDTARFAAHFGGAPVVDVSGRSYPVEIRYRPLDVADTPEDDEPGEPRDPDPSPPAQPARGRSEVRDQVDAIVDAVDELRAEGPGDVLVFLSGEQEIRDAADALAGRDYPATEILPLFARLSAAEQHRVFAPHPGRRIVLATNVAETSLTVPGIRYVVDPGTARISRYSRRTKVQRLPIEPISQASANQRAGRCGRVAPGVCIRLYSEDDLRSRPEFTEPEILRTNLASVVLQMAAWGVGEVADFPFLDPPDRRQVRDAVAVLDELGATERDGSRLTRVGRSLARLPVDPRIGRMLLAAADEGCLREVLVIGAALSIQDPRERPLDARAQADAAHARFADRESDFLAYLALWEYLRERRRELGSGAFRRLCRDEYLHYLRVREWQDVHAQLRQAVAELGLRGGRAASGPASLDRAAVHRAVLAGLLTQVGMLESPSRDRPGSRGYLGTRGARFALSPGSALARRPPRWVMAAELVETSRLWARTAARIEPEWVERLAGHLVVREHSEPHWDRRRGRVTGYERVTLLGLPLVARRRIGWAAVDAVVARELFLRHALVEGDWDTRHEFFHANRALLAEAAELEERVRRRDLVLDDEALLAFYDARVPADVVSARHFDAWWKAARRERPGLLTLDPATLVPGGGASAAAAGFPPTWEQAADHQGTTLALEYRFEPGAHDDGVTVVLPLGLLEQVRDEAFTWQVPGLREELVVALIRALPKALRRSFVPAPTYGAAVAQRLPADGPASGRSLTSAVVDQLRSMGGPAVDESDVDLTRVPGHLRVRFRVVDGQGQTLATGRDLAALRQRLAGRLRATVGDAAADLTRTGLVTWGDLRLPDRVDRVVDGQRVTGWPALVDEGDSVAARVLASAAEQSSAHPRGLRRLLQLDVPSPTRRVVAALSAADRLVLASSSYPGVSALLDDCVLAAVDAVVAAVDAPAGPVRDPDAYAALRVAVAERLPAATQAVVGDVLQVLRAAQPVRDRLAAPATNLAVLPSLADARAHLDRLVGPGYVMETGAHRLRDVVRYLRALDRRLAVLPTSPQRDLARLAEITELEAEVTTATDRLPAARRGSAEVQALRWQLEELRVSLFAQSVGTAGPVSAKRVRAALAGLADAQ